jgi:hypothetical protein
VRIVASQDVAITAMLLDTMSVCDMDNKNLSIVLTNQTAQAIDYSKYPTSLQVNVSGTWTQAFNIPLIGSLAGYASDTIEVFSGHNFVAGTYNIEAFMATSIDDEANNDSISTSFALLPELQSNLLNLTTPSQPTTCVFPNTIQTQDILIRNTGNVDFGDIVAIMYVVDGSDTIATAVDTLSAGLVAGDSVIHTFSATYTAPYSAYFNVSSFVYLSCDAQIAHSHGIAECVDLHDIALISIENPSGSDDDSTGRPITVWAKLQNNDPDNDFNNVKVHVEVGYGATVAFTQTDNVSQIIQGEEYTYTCSRAYIVPDTDTYYVKVYLETQDRTPLNDTLSITRTAVDTVVPPNAVLPTSKESITLSQNIPNPAGNTTKVEYSLPHDGKATFNIYTTAGQVIYTQSVDAIVGTNNIIFDLNGLSSGIYFYSMEFEGQKLVRKMSVK